MKLEGRFERQELEVGLSADLPLGYQGPEEKYAAADSLAQPFPRHIKFTREIIEFELHGTSFDPGQMPTRFRCHMLVNNMPNVALHEVEEELREMYQHYISLEAVARLPALPPPSKAATATVIEHVKT